LKAGIVTSDKILDDVLSELIRKHRCHTVLLYGSRATGRVTPTSDYDIAGIRKTGRTQRIARRQDGYYLDIFVFAERDLKFVDSRFSYLDGAKVLFRKGQFGSRFLRRLKLALKKRPKTLPADEIGARKVWAFKMLDRAALEDVEGHYRRSWLQTALLEDFFLVRRKQYKGSKAAFSWLHTYDLKTYRLFEDVLKNPGDLKRLRLLVQRVTGRKGP
jgi:uncharacterized protein